MTDLRLALRSLARSPLFVAVALCSLALGIGANTAVFSITKAILLRSLPVPNPDQLRLVQWTGRNASLVNFTGSFERRDVRAQSGTFSYPAYCDLRDRAAAWAEIFAWFQLYQLTTRVGDHVGSSQGAMVSGNFFHAYGAAAQIGRVLTPEDDRAGAEPVVVLTDRFWEKRFARSAEALGQTLEINRHAFTIIGVLPRQFAGPMMGDPADVYLPIAAQPRLEPFRSLTSYDNWWVVPMARLAPGANEAQLRDALTAIFAQGLHQGRTRLDEPQILLENGRGGVINARRAVTPALLGLQAIVVAVLAIACANLAGLLLARAVSRRREFAICAAIGASRYLLIRRTLAESLVLALAGGALGLVCALWIKSGLLRYLPHDRFAMHFDTSIDLRVLLFTALVAIVAGLLCGLLPAWRAARANPARDLRGSRAAGFTRQRLGRTLVTTQVALSVVLVTMTGLFARSITQLRAVDPGFDPQNLLLFLLHADRAAYAEPQQVAFFDDVRAAIAAIPGVHEVALSDLPLVSRGVATSAFSLPGRERRPDEAWHAHVMTVSEGYFATMRIPLLRGRDFDAGDHAASAPVIVVNQQFADRHFPDEDPVGRVVHISRSDYRIVGVATATLYHELKGGKPATIYFSSRQRPRETLWVAARTAVAPGSLVPAMRRAVAAIDPFVPLAEITTQTELFDRALFLERLFALFCGSLGSLAVALSCIGVYGLLAYSVTQRTAEIGVRMALGALPGEVARTILREASLLMWWGLVCGLALAIGIGFATRGVFFGIAPYDPPALAITILALTATAALAAWLPARRAARIDPILALRTE